jgi:choline-glycine betaine transporter
LIPRVAATPVTVAITANTSIAPPIGPFIDFSPNIGTRALQINEGLNFLFNVPNNFGTQVILIIIATILFTCTKIVWNIK